MDLKQTLLNLCKLKKVSGDEQEIAQNLKSTLLKFSNDVEITSNNSAIAKISSAKLNSPEIILNAHIDEIGFIVSNITEGGFLEIKTCGGVNLSVASCQNVEIYGKKVLPGLTFTNNGKLFVDTGFKKKSIENLVSLGNKVGFKFNPVIFNNNRICSKSLDDCAGVATILLVLEKLKNVSLNCNLTIIFSSQEETSGTGVITSSYAQNADLAICVDVSFAKFLGCDDSSYGTMSKGPLIGISPILDLHLSDELQNIAKLKKIPFQLEIMNGLTSTDADKIVRIKNGIRACLCSIPIKYMHSPVEMADLTDIENTANLIANFIKTM